MTDYIDLALRYGGFTSLDKSYLKNTLDDLTEEQKLRFITPPPSVINAYFSELYQKKSPEVATDYFFEVSEAFRLFNEKPNFEEKLPFIRLNLSGKAYGFCYSGKDKKSLVFPEYPTDCSSNLLFEIASIFPHYLVYYENHQICMKTFDIEEVVVKSESLSDLTDLDYLENSIKKISGYNQEEVYEFAKMHKEKLYYRSQNRSAMIYLI
ncbi:MAG: cystathionine beta-lyase [Streptococcus sp.]|nr:cystathionine beta-lyase [Streptococcus sp.]